MVAQSAILLLDGGSLEACALELSSASEVRIVDRRSQVDFILERWLKLGQQIVNGIFRQDVSRIIEWLGELVNSDLITDIEILIICANEQRSELLGTIVKLFEE